EIAAHIVVVKIALVVILARRLEKVVRQRVSQKTADPDSVLIFPGASHLTEPPEVVVLFGHKLRQGLNLFPRLGYLPRSPVVGVRIFEAAVVLLKYWLGLHGKIRID